ncbi:hypothetical protein R3I94_016889 [Phoxinus phoxinus]
MASRKSVSGETGAKTKQCLIQSESNKPRGESMKSEQSMDNPFNFSSADSSADVSMNQEESKSSTRRQLDIFKKELKRSTRLLSPDYPEFSEREEEEEEEEDEGQRTDYPEFFEREEEEDEGQRTDYPEFSEREEEEDEEQSRVRQGFLKTLQVLRNRNHTDITNTLQNSKSFIGI